MLLKIFKNRTVSSSGTWGTKNENNYEILNFEFPEELEEYNKRIVYYLGNQKVWDAIIDNKAILTNAITTKGSVKAYIWCTKSDEAFETDVDFRTQIFVMNFFENDNADGIVPTPEQVDGFNTMLTAMNAKIDEVDALETTIETAEAERQEAEATRVSNENTRQSNESTRQTNEQTRQTQEADRERRTDEAIADIEDKTAAYNANAEAKTNEFNDLVETQKLVGVSAVETASSEAITDFNTNATNKTNDFNSNATEKTSEFNTNAESKTSAFNDNATQKTTNFDNNASEKTDEFNNNAQEKIDEYDEHIVEYQAQIDELQEEVDELSENMPWDTTEQGTEIQVTDAAKYSKNKLELFGNTSQDSTTGVQLLDMSDAINGYFIGNNGAINTANTGFHTQEYIDVSNKSTMYARFEALSDIKIARFWMQEYDENYNSLQRTVLGLYDVTFTNGEVKKYSKNFLSDTKYIRLSSYSLQELESGSYVNKNPVKDNWNNLMKATISFTDVDVFEPYTGGQPSPSPDHPQPIHVVTGNNSVGVQGKNLFDKNKVTIYSGYFSAAGVINGKGTNNSPDKWFYISCKPNTTYKIIKPVTPVLSNNRFRIGTTASIPNNNSTLDNFWMEPNGSTVTQHVITTSNNAKYLCVFYGSNPDAWNDKILAVLNGLMISYFSSYSINLGSIELRKIGDYQDYLYKENGNWYIQKNTGKTILGKPTTGNLNTDYTYNYFSYRGEPSGIYPGTDIICSHFIGAYNLADMRTKAQYNNSVYWGSNNTFVRVDKFNTVEEYINALSANDITIIGRARTPTTTQITDETLISQLDAIYEHLQLVKGTNNITVTASDLAPYMELTYMQDLPTKLNNLASRIELLEE